jgi:hemolysin activation/secretion protein
VEIDSQERAPSPSPADGIRSEPSAGGFPGAADIPSVSGLTIYSRNELERILAGCGAEAPDQAQRLKDCAAALTARLVADGYVNSRTYVEAETPPGRLLVVEGVLAELRVQADDPHLEQRVNRWLQPLHGRVLHLPGIERQLQLLRRQRGVASVRGNLSRLGSDSSQGVLTVAVTSGGLPWQGDFSLRNDGTSGSGDMRSVGTLLKPDLALRGDTLLLYGEANGTSQPRFGSVISSISYSVPVGDQIAFTGAFGFSRRNLIELEAPADQLSINQFQGLGQLDWTFHDSLQQRWNLFLGLSGNRSQTFLAGRKLDTRFFPESAIEPRSAYLRLGLSGSGMQGPIAWGGNVYFLQGLGAATPERQRRELALVGIQPGRASAIGTLVAGSWRFAPSWQLNLQAAGQLSFYPLTSPMQFTLGSDVGLRGLPGQLISGDDGWLTTAELVWSLWRSSRHEIQLLPFMGAGGVRTKFPNAVFTDTVGSGGLLGRWLAGEHWVMELGWVEHFSTGNNEGVWQDQALGQGLYGKVQYRF